MSCIVKGTYIDFAYLYVMSTCHETACQHNGSVIKFRLFVMVVQDRTALCLANAREFSRPLQIHTVGKQLAAF